MDMELYGCRDGDWRGAGYALLAWAARREWGMDALPPVARGERGKPFFPDQPRRHFSISHSGGLVLCALDELPAGADVELVRPHYPGLARRVCAPAELAWLEGQEDRERALSMLWTMKESRVKYTGTGLTVPIRTIRVPLPPPRDRYAVLDGLVFRVLEGPEWTACLCGHSACGPIRWAEAGELEGPGKKR